MTLVTSSVGRRLQVLLIYADSYSIGISFSGIRDTRVEASLPERCTAEVPKHAVRPRKTTFHAAGCQSGLAELSSAQLRHVCEAGDARANFQFVPEHGVCASGVQLSY